ncbi:MAG: type II CRISPR RNA-guided endonuclease Cas9 [Gammaproteobacteria bacterium]|nr:type II CRISPR RNA-guided endonuclease Cas9 [Gammaproteobacteria bacterium]
MDKNQFRYVLGIDVGVASLGMAVIKVDKKNKPIDIEQGFVRTWSVPEGSETRRLARSQRRIIDRKKSRLRRISQLFEKKGIGYPLNKVPKEILDKSPFKLRSKAVSEKIDLQELQRILLHIAKHRGSSAFDNYENDEKESKITKVGIQNLENEMLRLGFKTYGQYLRWREKKGLFIRINQEKNDGGNYDFYPSRELLKKEFEIIWSEQKKWYPEILDDKFKQTLYEALFNQRKVTTPKPGKCPFFPNDNRRLPKASRLFQIKRIYEEVNNLRFYDHLGNILPYKKIQRDTLVNKLMEGIDLNKTSIKKYCGHKTSCRVNFEHVKTKDKIAKYPFSESDLGKEWVNLGKKKQDKVLKIMASEIDKNEAKSKINENINLTENTIDLLFKASFPNGYGSIGKKATKLILKELKKNHAISSQEAEVLAGLNHFMSPTGEIYNRLPYYGEILKGYALEPVWIFGDNPSNQHPSTNINEKKFGRAPNPVVHVALNQIRKMVNCLIEKYGLPEKIFVELSRDLGRSEEAKKDIEKQNSQNQKERERIRSELEKNHIIPNYKRELKYELWKQQGFRCIYTGDCISLTQLYNGEAEIDHILPRSKTLDASKANKVVCKKSANALKKNRTPHEAFSNHPDYDWDAINRYIKDLPRGKRQRFQSDALDKFLDNPNYWRERYANDNSYIAKVTRQYLSSLYGETSNVISVSSRITSLLRRKWGLNKILGESREFKQRDDHRHHYIDALIVGCTSRSIIQEIQTSARKSEEQGLDKFVDKVQPPFGRGDREFVSKIELATKDVILSRKPDNSSVGQLHEDTLRGIIAEPLDNGKYLTRTKIDLAGINTLEDLKKKKIQPQSNENPIIDKAIEHLEKIKIEMEDFCRKAKTQLEDKSREEIAQGKKGQKITESKIFKEALKLRKEDKLSCYFWYFQERTLVNVRTSGNKPYGGYISGRNHRMDFYHDKNGKLNWQLISMTDANNKFFVPESKKEGNRFLWSAHKDDILLLDDPENPKTRIRMVVVKISEGRMGIVNGIDARDSKNQDLLFRRLSFFERGRAQRIITNAIGEPTFYFPML